MYVSDEAVRKVTEEIVVNREQRRRIQQMSTKELTAYLVGVYRNGFEDGAEAIELAAKQKQEDTEEVSVDWDDVLALIRTVKGIGPKMAERIDQRLREAF